MQRRTPRAALAASCIAALAAVAAGSAQAAVTATTLPVTAVTARTATLNGIVTTGAAPVTWVFSYSLASNPFAGSFSTGGSIGPGVTAANTVADAITGLTPSTVYTFELVATDVTYGPAYSLNVPIYGAPPLTFTTKGPGKASLASKKLKLKNGRVKVPVKCSRALDCTGGVLAITARHKGKKLSCASATFAVPAGKKKTVSTKVSKKCTALITLAPTNKIKANLTAGFTFQKGISAGVTLIG